MKKVFNKLLRNNKTNKKQLKSMKVTKTINKS